MFNTTKITLKILAALVWYPGVGVLIIKSSGLFLAANEIGAAPPWVLLAILGGIGIGLIKGKYLFASLCRKNLHRIESLENPMIWQFYRARFFIFLGLMVALGITFSRMAQGDYRLLIPLAILELSIGIALLSSSRCFWHR